MIDFGAAGIELLVLFPYQNERSPISGHIMCEKLLLSVFSVIYFTRTGSAIPFVNQIAVNNVPPAEVPSAISDCLFLGLPGKFVHYSSENGAFCSPNAYSTCPSTRGNPFLPRLQGEPDLSD
jgi:hypothetical protein